MSTRIRTVDDARREFNKDLVGECVERNLDAIIGTSRLGGREYQCHTHVKGVPVAAELAKELQSLGFEVERSDFHGVKAKW